MKPPQVVAPRPTLPKAPQLRLAAKPAPRVKPKGPPLAAPARPSAPPKVVLTRKTALKTAAAVTLVAKLASFSLVDAALVGSGVATAVGSVVFAGAMLMQGDHPPSVNGVQYLAMFAQPKVAASAAQGSHAPQVVANVGVDFTPLGAIAPAGASASGGYELVSAQSTLAWVRAGSRILAVKPGDELPGLGAVRAIVWDSGRWTLVGDNDKLLLHSGGSAAPGNGRTTPPFSRQLIFGSQN